MTSTPVVPPPASLTSLHRDIALLKRLTVPTDVPARTRWPTGKVLSRSSTMGSNSLMPESGGRYGAPLPLGTPMRPSTVTSAYSSSFELLPGRPPTAPLCLGSTEEAEEAVYARRVLKSASMPYLYRPVSAMPRAPPVHAVRNLEEQDNEVFNVTRLPNLTAISNSGYDVAGSNQFDLNAVFGPKPGRGARRPRTFRVAGPDED